MADTTVVETDKIEQGVSFSAWVKAFRLPFHSALILPFLLGMVLAWYRGYPLDWKVLVLGELAVFFMTGNCFLSNEYFDLEADQLNRLYNRFTGGSRVLPEGRLSQNQVLAMALFCMFAAMVLGVFLQFYFKTGLWTIPLGAMGLATGFFYTARPVRLAYRGLGELSIGLMIGWLTVYSGYYVQAHRGGLFPTVISLPWAIATVLLIWINEFPDYESDKIANKNNLVVRLGLEKAALVHNGLIVVMWLSAIPMLFIVKAPVVSFLFLIIPFTLSSWNLVAVFKGEWRDRKKLEAICARTIVYCITLVVAITGIFLWKGLVS